MHYQQGTDSKFSQVAKELQGVKSQIYYLQQSFLQIRGALKSNNEEVTLPSPILASSNNNEIINQLEAKISQCASQNDLMLLTTTFNSKTEEFSQMFTNVNEELKTLDKLTAEMDPDDFTKSVQKNTIRIDKMETAERKNNLIIRGLKQDKRLERTHHLEAVLKSFFNDILNLEDIHFEEVSNRAIQSVVFNSGPEMALRAFYFIRTPIFWPLLKTTDWKALLKLKFDY